MSYMGASVVVQKWEGDSGIYDFLRVRIDIEFFVARRTPIGYMGTVGPIVTAHRRETPREGTER